ncbi:hypothetical protein BJX63DRAFT_128267 [Aspergillus granulosus]|uniref:Uncharacterized protein n=1 Tax=Aspergillus granulosus TaxID=176169 RepID=A0ABR4HQ87_9EURO
MIVTRITVSGEPGSCSYKPNNHVMRGPYTAHIHSMLQSRPYLGQLCNILQQEDNGVTRFALVTFSRGAAPQIHESTELKQAKNIIEQKHKEPVARFRVCIVENISPAFIELLGSAWELNVEFFVDHAVGCRGDLSRVPFNLASIRERAPFLCVDGVLSYSAADVEAAYGDEAKPIPKYLYRVRKHYFRRDFRIRTDGKGFQLDTRTSYYVKKLRDNDWIAVCLIDPPIVSSKASDLQGVIRFPLASLWQNSLRSAPLDIRCEDGLYDAMTKFLRGEGAGYYERCTVTPFTPASFLFLYTALTWQEMCNRLQITIKRISFAEIRAHPSMELSERLHEMRENIFYMKQSLTQALQALRRHGEYDGGHVPLTQEEIENKNLREETTVQFRDMYRSFQVLLEDAIQLENVVLHSFDVLMSSIVVQETQMSHKNSELGIQHSKLGIEQSKMGLEQATSVKILTQLAFLYIPLTFVSGVFGMNLQELNGTGQHIWVFFVACVIAAMLTFTVLVIFRICVRSSKRAQTLGV